MAESSKEPKFSLRLVIDEEKNKVVLAEACRDFVDVLFSILTLPMGTIVRLLAKHRKSELVTVGCFSNLYKSVVEMGIENFETEACKEMLLYPRSVGDVQCKRLKLNINPNEDDDLTYFRCCSFLSCKTVSDFSTSRCRCGKLMDEVDKFQIPAGKVVDNIQNGVFIGGRSAFIITDDLKVSVISTELVLQKIKSTGCGDFSKVGERLVDIGFEEVLTLLQSIFSSNAPLTDTFLNKQISQGVMKTCESLSTLMEAKTDEAEVEPEEILILNAIVRKQDMEILFVECKEDFVDLLFTFLAVPLESVLDVSGDSSSLGYIGNLFKSFKDLSAATTKSMLLPHYYKCKKQLLNIITEKPRPFKIFSTKEPVVWIDPKSHGIKQSTEGSWFVKRDTKFTVSDDLIVTPMNSSSVFCLLKKFEIQAKDLEVQEISISKTEATNLLRASLVMTSSVLNTALCDLITKEKPTKKRTFCETQLRRSQRKKKT